MNFMIDFSICIPTYNSEKTIKYTLDSIQEQDIDKNRIEVIVLDGGSIVDFDTHENLLQNCAIYQDIYNSQLKREGDDNE